MGSPVDTVSFAPGSTAGGPVSPLSFKPTGIQSGKAESSGRELSPPHGSIPVIDAPKGYVGISSAKY